MSEFDGAKAAEDIAMMSSQMIELRLQQLQSKSAKDHSERDKVVLGLLQSELAKRK